MFCRIKRRRRFKRKISKNLLEGFGDCIVERDGEALEARDIDIAGLSRLIECETDAQFPLVKAERLGPDERASESKYTCRSHGVEEASGGGVDSQKSFGAQNPNETCTILPPVIAVLAERTDGCIRARNTSLSSPIYVFLTSEPTR